MPFTSKVDRVVEEEFEKALEWYKSDGYDNETISVKNAKAAVIKDMENLKARIIERLEDA